jgi:hypothetical protein
MNSKAAPTAMVQKPVDINRSGNGHRMHEARFDYMTLSGHPTGANIFTQIPTPNCIYRVRSVGLLTVKTQEQNEMFHFYVTVITNWLTDKVTKEPVNVMSC